MSVAQEPKPECEWAKQTLEKRMTNWKKQTQFKAAAALITIKVIHIYLN